MCNLLIDGDYFCYTRREPIGVVGAILPWNFPMFLTCFKLGAALACGNSIVIKPSEETPLATLYLGSLVVEVSVTCNPTTSMATGSRFQVIKVIAMQILWPSLSLRKMRDLSHHNIV